MVLPVMNHLVDQSGNLLLYRDVPVERTDSDQGISANVSLFPPNYTLVVVVGAIELDVRGAQLRSDVGEHLCEPSVVTGDAVVRAPPVPR